MHGQRPGGDATGFCRPHLPNVNVQSVDTAATSTNDADEIGPGKHEYSQNTHSVAELHWRRCEHQLVTCQILPAAAHALTKASASVSDVCNLECMW